MSIPETGRLETLYARLKQHEQSLAVIACGRLPTDHDIVCELLNDTRAMALELEPILESNGIEPASVPVPPKRSDVSLKVLIEQRQAFRQCYEAALKNYGEKPDVVHVLKTQRGQLNGSGQEKLEIMGAALMGSH